MPEETKVRAISGSHQPEISQFPKILLNLLAEGRKEGTLEAERVAAVVSVARNEDGEKLSDDAIEVFYTALEGADIQILEPLEEEEAEELDEVDAEDIEKIKADFEAETTSTDGVRLYFNSISQHTLLSRKEEIELAKKKDLYLDKSNPHHIRVQGKEALDQMLRANLRLVVSIARRYKSSGLPLMDLCQEGSLGLYRAIEKFDWTMGYKLSTYATWWIRQAITRAIADQGRPIRIPVHKTEQLNRYRRGRSRLEAQFGREPTMDELIEYLGMSFEEIDELQQLAIDPVSLNARVGDSEQSELGDLYADENAIQPEVSALQGEPARVLERALSALPLVERKVIKLRHGIGDEPPRTLEEVAYKLGLTRERVRQHEQDAWETLGKTEELAEIADYIFET